MALVLLTIPVSLTAADWAAQEWREAPGAYGDARAMVPDGGGYLFVVAANRLASPESRATLRLIVDDVSAGARWISDGPVTLQVDGNPAVVFPDCAMHPLSGRFGSDPVDLFCASNRDKVVMEIRKRALEDRFLGQLRAGTVLMAAFAATDGTARRLSFSLRRSGETIDAVLAAPAAGDTPPIR